MAGQDDVLEAEGVQNQDVNADVTQQTNGTNTTTQQTDIHKTGNDSLDKRLEELATGSSRGNETQKNQTDNKQQLSAEQIADAKAKQTQDKATTTQPIVSRTGVGGFTGKAPRAYGPRFNWDAQGNVIDKTTGGIIAAAGSERKAFERMVPIINAHATEADKYKGMYEAAIKGNTIATSLNLSPEEYSIGARIMAQWKTDPKKSIAFMIKEAQNNGVDVSDLGVAAGAGPSVQQIQTALEDIVKKHLEPFSFITTEREDSTRRTQELAEATSVVDEFYGIQPDARIHEDSLAKIMNARPNTSLNEAYLILKNHALENKLDWTKDLVPQIQALVTKQPNGQTPNGQPANPQRQLPNLNGRPNSDAIVPRRNGTMSGDTSSKNIVLEAMRAAGMNVTDI